MVILSKNFMEEASFFTGEMQTLGLVLTMVEKSVERLLIFFFIKSLPYCVKGYCSYSLTGSTASFLFSYIVATL